VEVGYKKLIGEFCRGARRSSAKNHHYNHPIITHEWSFLPGEKSHYHTMKAGQHVFPFNFTFPGNLPSSIRTYLNDADITYKLKATAHRSAFQHNFHAAKNVTVLRGFTNEALEYNQTLEIENTWPGKVMYCLTLPHKAYAAGDEIPVSVKFMPLAKGTRVTHITSVIKEYTLVHTRHSSHPEVSDLQARAQGGSSVPGDGERVGTGRSGSSFPSSRRGFPWDEQRSP
jgi:hypothetical protein